MKKSLLFTSLLLSGIFSISCVYFAEMEAFRIMVFRPEVMGDMALSPFFYSGDRVNRETSDPNHADWYRNAREWQAEVGTSVKVEHIITLLYKVPVSFFLESVAENKLTANFPDNTFAKLLSQKKEYLDYVVLARKAEQAQLGGNFSLWSSEDGKAQWPGWDNQAIELTGLKSEAEIDAMSNAFLRTRYAYQLIRENSADGERLYDKFFNGQETSSLMAAYSLIFKADVVKDKTMSNLLYFRVFDNCDYKKLACYNRFLWSGDVYNKTLNLAASPQEKAGIMSLAAMAYPGPALDRIKAISALDPNCKYLKLLVAREISKLDNWLYAPSLTGRTSVPGDDVWSETPAQRNLAKDKEYTKQVLAQVQSLNLPDGAFKSLCVGHLQLLSDEIAAAKSTFAALENGNVSSNIKLQMLCEQFVIMANEEDVSDAGTQQKLFKLLQGIDNQQDQIENPKKLISSLLLFLSKKFELKGDYARAGLLYKKSLIEKEFGNDNTFCWSEEKAKNQRLLVNTACMDYDYENYYPYIGYFDRLAQPKDMDVLIGLLNKTNPSDFERVMLSQKLGEVSAYYDLKGTLAFRKNDLATALDAFKHCPDTFWLTKYEFKTYLNSDPFAMEVSDKPYNFNKAKFVERLIEKQKQFERAKGQDKCRLALMVAHAYYNTSYHGKCWMMFKYGKSNYESPQESSFNYYSGYAYIAQDKHNEYYYSNKANEWYQKAYEIAQKEADPETASKALFYQFAIERSSKNLGNYEDEKPYKSALLAKFVEQYKDMPFYQQMECPGWELYL